MIDSSVLVFPVSATSKSPAPSLKLVQGASGAARVLVVDDELTMRRALVRYLRERAYDAHECASGPPALALLEKEHFDILVCDVGLPGMPGLDLASRALELDRNVAVLMLSTVDGANAAKEALGRGVLDYLVKPISPADLHRAIERALHRRQLDLEHREAERTVRNDILLRRMELEREKAVLHGLTVSMAETLINAMEAKDVYLRGHSRRVGELAASVAEEMGLDADLVEQVRLAGRLHDIGKIGIREDVLNKPDALTDEEYAHVQEHVRIGMEILAPLAHIPETLEFIHDHHERFDGSGYPRGRAGTDISIGGRILAACDAFDAMTSRRAYREAFDEQATISRLASDVGRLIDPHVFTALEKVVVRRKTLPFIDDLHA